MSRRSSSQKKKKSSQSAFRRASAVPRSNSRKSSMNSYLLQLGENIRAVRARRGMTIHQLARASALSARFLTTVELGRGNISVGRLNTIAHAMEVPIEMLAADAQPTSPTFNQSTEFLKKLPPGQLRDAHKLLLEKFANVDASVRRSRIALIGLRGAGKSILGKHPRFVLATGGGIVSDPANFNRLLGECFTIWLRAKPEEHMARVLAQGDRRPMAHNRQAMRDLHRILWSREALYRQADTVVETTGQTVKQSLQALALAVGPKP